MAQTATTSDLSLAEVLGPESGLGLRVKQAVLVLAGIALLAIAAKIQVPLWPSPVPVTMGTFAVLTIGASYGPRLGLATIVGYLALGAAGLNIFASSSAENYGIGYMLGGSGGYLLGYILAVAYLGWSSRRGLDRSIEGMGGAMLVASLAIYVPGLLWLNQWIVVGDRFNAAEFSSIWDQTLAWGLTPFLIGDLLKLALAALLIPALWALVGKARR
ncbi:biotin transporter BioY [Actibacterium sp. 188UL27-1]|uniref:biotin transporter BioY n=1 Tax=Actibacterium sp. 188UL27-1 TaxID=2786961 RepID=UPI0019564FC7|nr:biotin transporter BioY [Actibacterium sp. 188UL27-1]MBM7066756.1 biotin transporter BioY [Actibacterium sp. 188UL27-1]